MINTQKEIVEQNSTQSMDQHQDKNNKPYNDLLSKLKYANISISTPKAILLILLFLTLIVLYLALVLLSTKEQSVPSTITFSSPSPSPEEEIDPQTRELQTKIGDFQSRLDNSFSYSDKLKVPTVDLEINF